MPTISLPLPDGRLAPYRLASDRAYPTSKTDTAPFDRIALAAAHVVADPLAAHDPWLDARLDWDRTLAYRRHLWGLGLGVAESMDTAQRGMGLDWPTSLELIRRSVDAARDIPGAVVFSGVGTDHLAPGRHDLAAVISAYEMQLEAVQGAGGRVILMASRALAASAAGPDDYARVYDRVLAQAAQPVIIHWLGDMFDPALAGYWGGSDLDRAMDTALDVIIRNAARIDGVKISLLDKHKEIAMRRRLPPRNAGKGVRMYTGDDFAYAELIAGDAQGHSDALLGIFDAIAPAASAALSAHARGEHGAFHDILGPTVALSRHIFQAPTRFYKTGVVFMAYLNGHQPHFAMVGGQQSARSALHLAELFRLADQASLLADPDRATARMRTVMAVHGVA